MHRKVALSECMFVLGSMLVIAVPDIISLPCRLCPAICLLMGRML